MEVDVDVYVEMGIHKRFCQLRPVSQSHPFYLRSGPRRDMVIDEQVSVVVGRQERMLGQMTGLANRSDATRRF